MAMVYTLVSSAKEWLSERYGVDTNAEDAEAEEATKDDVWMFYSFNSFLYLLLVFFFFWIGKYLLFNLIYVCYTDM